MSCELFYSVCVESLDVGNLIESDHMPVILAMKTSGATNVDMKVLESTHKFVNKIVWDKAKEQEFQCLIGSVESS